MEHSLTAFYFLAKEIFVCGTIAVNRKRIIYLALGRDASIELVALKTEFNVSLTQRIYEPSELSGSYGVHCLY